MNHVVLSACLFERSALRYTPAGIPALDFGLRHDSQMEHAGSLRSVKVDLKARGLGELTDQLARIELGVERVFTGFLGSQRNGRGVVFHVTALD
jgi:primosomal replication protein N